MSGGANRGIGGWIKNSFIDFPGTVSTVLFFRGCNLRCPYCHNPGLVRDDDPTPVDFETIYSCLRRRRGIIEGAVLSGGEPTLHGGDLLYVVQQLRALDLKIKLDTNGLLPDMITAVAPDYCALDLKTTPSRYGELGYSKNDAGEALNRSLDIVKALGNNAEVRITVAAPFAGERDVDAFATLLEGVAAVYLQPFRSSAELLDPGFAERGHVPIETIRRYRDRVAQVVKKCAIRGE